jgi:hypothetical protein
MGILRPVIEVAATPMPDLWQHFALRYAVALQPVSDQPTRLVLEACEQAPEEPLGCTSVPPILNEDVQHHAVLVHRSPEVIQHAIDTQKYLILSVNLGSLLPGPARSGVNTSSSERGGILEVWTGCPVSALPTSLTYELAPDAPRRDPDRDGTRCQGLISQGNLGDAVSRRVRRTF